MRKSFVTSLLAIILIAVTISACRAPRRGVVVEGETKTIEVTLLGLDEQDAGKSDWIYELSGCVDPINGTLKDNNTVTFTSATIAEGMNCELQVKDLKAAPTVAFDGDKNVMYIADNVSVSTTMLGTLSAHANLSKKYSLGATPPTDPSVTVVTTPGDCKAENNMIWNPDTKECVKKP
jgi:hypothetical protein